MFIDTHCHFDFSPFVNDIDNSLHQLEVAKVNKIIVPAVSADHFDLVIDLTEKYHQIYGALGFHPIYQRQRPQLLKLTDKLSEHHNKIVAIGELGLDSYIDNADLVEQHYFLQQQFDLAKQFNLPVILHSRRTHALLKQALKSARLPQTGVVHGFAGSYEEAMQFIRLGYYIGVGGVISYARANKTRQAISKIPLESIILETDAPDMPLSGLQGQPNRPEYITKVFNILTELRTEPVDQIQTIILQNTLRLFPKLLLTN